MKLKILQLRYMIKWQIKIYFVVRFSVNFCFQYFFSSFLIRYAHNRCAHIRLCDVDRKMCSPLEGCPHRNKCLRYVAAIFVVSRKTKQNINHGITGTGKKVNVSRSKEKCGMLLMVVRNDIGPLRIRFFCVWIVRSLARTHYHQFYWHWLLSHDWSIKVTRWIEWRNSILFHCASNKTNTPFLHRTKCLSILFLSTDEQRAKRRNKKKCRIEIARAATFSQICSFNDLHNIRCCEPTSVYSTAYVKHNESE